MGGEGRNGGQAQRHGLRGRLTGPIAQFAFTGLVAVAVVGVAAVFVLRHEGQSQSITNARQVTRLLGHGIVEPVLADGVLRGRPGALARLDRVVRRRVLGGPVVRVKIWTAAGRIVYSDESRLIGARYTLGAEDREALETGRVAAEISDLSRPENRFERNENKLLEVYLPVRTRGGTPLLFESYLRYSDVSAGGRKLFLAFAPALVGALVALWLLQLPLASSLARRLRRGQQERETLLLRALDASDAERRRIAADLHDGVVQDLAGTAFALGADAERAREADRGELATSLREGAATTRQAMRQLRSLLVEIYPPNLRTAGLESALSDLLAKAAARGLATDLEVQEGLELSEAAEQLLFRTAQEAVRNVVDHAAARSVRVSVRRTEGAVELVVADDGRGFGRDGLASRREAGHVGLSLLEERARDVGGRVEIASEPGEGTRLTLAVPS